MDLFSRVLVYALIGVIHFSSVSLAKITAVPPAFAQLNHTGQVIFEIGIRNIRNDDRCHESLLNCTRPSTADAECSLVRYYMPDTSDAGRDTWYCAVRISNMTENDVGVYNLCKLDQSLSPPRCHDAIVSHNIRAWYTYNGHTCMKSRLQNGNLTDNCTGITTPRPTTTAPTTVQLSTVLGTNADALKLTKGTPTKDTEKNNAGKLENEKATTTNPEVCKNKYGLTDVIVGIIVSFSCVLIVIGIVYTFKRFKKSFKKPYREEDDFEAANENEHLSNGNTNELNSVPTDTPTGPDVPMIERTDVSE